MDLYDSETRPYRPHCSNIPLLLFFSSSQAIQDERMHREHSIILLDQRTPAADRAGLDEPAGSTGPNHHPSSSMHPFPGGSMGGGPGGPGPGGPRGGLPGGGGHYGSIPPMPWPMFPPMGDPAGLQMQMPRPMPTPWVPGHRPDMLSHGPLQPPLFPGQLSHGMSPAGMTHPLGSPFNLNPHLPFALNEAPPFHAYPTPPFHPEYPSPFSGSPVFRPREPRLSGWPSPHHEWPMRASSMRSSHSPSVHAPPPPPPPLGSMRMPSSASSPRMPSKLRRSLSDRVVPTHRQYASPSAYHPPHEKPRSRSTRKNVRFLGNRRDDSITLGYPSDSDRE
ncbi:uncharacterized protein BYT42DRAFT_562951 [Radiomyces spectabilis]|uniref:uncharacterized protein n=1 Tax=Radiomyces spectabilis TaxID=64574 RepID=UPI0022204089|nr:uncharacterized protein BYT42DRAFT_562951 [Radiomyces spectabilis]KAI8384575.1 hypothetical protein BYT42DRAFT_562951 [Radiomyces spectabilis]